MTLQEIRNRPAGVPIRNGTVLVLGASGAVGGAVSRRLLAEGVHVIAQGRNRARLSLLQGFGASSVQGNLRDPATGRALRRVASDALAVLSFLPPEPALMRAAGLLMTEMPGTCRIHLSSSAVYERTRDQYDLSEDAARPSNPFYAAERALLRGTQGCVTLIRPGRLYGAAPLTRPVRVWAEAAPLPLIRDGDVETSVLHLDDLSDAIIHLIGTPATGRALGAYNLASARFPVTYLVAKMLAGDGGRVSWRPASRIGLRVGEAARSVFSALNRSGPAPMNVARLLGWSLTLDGTAFRRETGWAPTSDRRDPVNEGQF